MVPAPDHETTLTLGYSRWISFSVGGAVLSPYIPLGVWFVLMANPAAALGPRWRLGAETLECLLGALACGLGLLLGANGCAVTFRLRHWLLLLPSVVGMLLNAGSGALVLFAASMVGKPPL